MAMSCEQYEERAKAYSRIVAKAWEDEPFSDGAAPGSHSAADNKREDTWPSRALLDVGTA